MVRDIKVIIGANYGDEGKGLMTDYFAQQARENGQSCIVVLTNGGAQRGHTVVTPDGLEHVFHHFGSGTYAGADTFLPKQFIVNPMIFIKELNEGLWRENFKIFIHPECLVSTPFDMLANMIIEESRGDARHGSVGVGIWETLCRAKDGNDAGTYSFQAMMALTDNDLREYLKKVRHYYKNKLFGVSLRKFADVFWDENLIDNYIKDFHTMCKICTVSHEYVLHGYDSIIFENGQGLLLDDKLNDPENGYYTTPSNTGFDNVKAILNPLYVVPSKFAKKEVVFVTRSYLTKHGGKDIPGKTEFDFIKKEDESNIHNDYQGDIMYAPIDLDDLQKRITNEFESKAIPLDWSYSLAITHCDELEPISCPFRERYTSYGRTRKDIKVRI